MKKHGSRFQTNLNRNRIIGMIQVICADDHALIRKGVTHILNKTSDIRVMDEAENGRDLLAKLNAGACDVILLDLFMPGMDAFDLIREIKTLQPEAAILVLSMHPEKQFGQQTLKAGVQGYVNKSGGLSDLVAAIRKVHSGKRYISAEMADKLAETFCANGDTEPHEALSEREFQVFLLIAAGRTSSEIADRLCISVKTVSTYRKRILEKMNLENNAQITYYAIQHRFM